SWAIVQWRFCTAGTVPKYLLMPSRVTVAMGRSLARQVVGVAGLPPPATTPALARHPQKPAYQDDASATQKPASPGGIFEPGVCFAQSCKLLLHLGIHAL